ncbi:nucleotidyltransferase family protein [uncultured Alsobacter sp.]|uniref:nucleotidyltransferase family protein n=1 Tax=uncultured Alsobacter sp. TaxID=1748258 RepID=UPI0025EC318A|nr:nucleotidyltransferase family protein [uncultured Alsobacter sp.]
MKPSVALNEKREAIREAFTRYRVQNPRVFGSVARGQDTEASDLDLLVDPLPGLSLFDLGGLQIELERLLGCEVDVVLADGLHRRIRTRVLSEAQPL